MVRLIAILLLLPLALSAQTIHVTSQNVIDLNPERDALTGLVGSQRIKATFTDGAEALDVTAGLPIPLVIKSRVDDFQISVLNTVTSTPPNVVWWTIPSLNAGSYELKATYTDPTDSFPVFWRYLTLTSAPSAAVSVTVTGITVNASVAVTNTVSSALNIYYWGTNVGSVTN